MADARIREVQPGATITVQALGFLSGQNPDIRLVLLTTGAVGLTLSPGGATEDSPGNYDRQLAVPTSLAVGDYGTEWLFSGVWHRDEDIIRVTGSPLAAAGRYTTADDVRDALAPEGADQTSKATAAVLSDSELEDAIGEAQGEIDARLGVRYSVPFDPVPAKVASLTRDLAAYEATLRHRRFQALDERHPVSLRHQHAMALLTDLQAGRATLETTVDEPDEISHDPTVVNQYEGTMFDLASLGLSDSSYPRGWPYG